MDALRNECSIVKCDIVSLSYLCKHMRIAEMIALRSTSNYFVLMFNHRDLLDMLYTYYFPDFNSDTGGFPNLPRATFFDFAFFMNSRYDTPYWKLFDRFEDHVRLKIEQDNLNEYRLLTSNCTMIDLSCAVKSASEKCFNYIIEHCKCDRTFTNIMMLLKSTSIDTPSTITERVIDFVTSADLYRNTIECVVPVHL